MGRIILNKFSVLNIVNLKRLQACLERHVLVSVREQFAINNLTSNMITQNYWVSGLCPSTGILGTRKHNVSETGSVSFLRRRGRHLLSWVP
jgi:hypothetical protein